MTTPSGLTRPDPRPSGAASGPSEHHAEVVVGIVEDLGAVSLVHRALAEAHARHAGVRVVRVLPPGSAQHDVLAADSLAYAVTRAAWQDGVTVPSRFEVAIGDPVEVLLERARTAALLVVGGDRHGATVAKQCQTEATCSVLVIAGP